MLDAILLYTIIYGKEIKIRKNCESNVSKILFSHYYFIKRHNMT